MTGAWTPWDPDLEGRVLHFVRHGQYESGESGSGGLTRLGERQAKRVARYFDGLPIAGIRSGDLLRAVQTADIVAAELGIRTVSRHRVLREVLVLRLTAGRVNGFERLRIHHASISCFVVTRGDTQVVGYDSIVHLPVSLRTFR